MLALTFFKTIFREIRWCWCNVKTKHIGFSFKCVHKKKLTLLTFSNFELMVDFIQCFYRSPTAVLEALASTVKNVSSFSFVNLIILIIKVMIIMMMIVTIIDTYNNRFN